MFFKNQLKKFKNDENYQFKNILVERHFLFRAIQEISEELTKNKERFFIDLGDMFLMIKHYFIGKKKAIMILILII